MPRLQILHHKSYHPYNEKNKARVREDEARAAEAELAKEQKRVEKVADIKDSEARLVELRRRAGSPSLQPKAESEDEGEDNLPSTSTSRDPDAIGSNLLERHRKKKLREEKKERKQRERLDFDFPSETARREKGKDKGKGKEAEVDDGDERFRINRPEDGDAGEKYHDKTWDDHGHINFFRDIERDEKPRAPTLAEISKKKAEQEMDKFTMYLKRPEREVKPWYTDPDMQRVEDKATDEETERRRARDRRGDIRAKERNDPMTQVNALLKSTPIPKRLNAGPATPSDPQAARIQREQSERQRALALIAKSKAVPKNGFWEDTPSTVAHPNGSWAENLERRKDRASNRFWDEERERDRVRGWERGVRGNRGGRSWEV